MRRSLLAASGLAFTLGLPARALAQSAPGTPAPFTLIDDEADIGKDKPPAADLRTGHIYLQPRLGVVAPAGKLAAAPLTSPNGGTPTSQLAGTGAGFGATLGIGITRHAVIEAVGQYTRFGAPSACPECSGSSIDLGLGVSYHLAQGVAIDPWISYGVGLRFATFHAQPTSPTVSRNSPTARCARPGKTSTTRRTRRSTPRRTRSSRKKTRRIAPTN